MSQSRQVTGKYGSRYYEWLGPDPEAFTATSVTTIISDGLPKPALTYWAANSVASEAVEKADKMAQLKEDLGEEGLYDHLKKSPWSRRDKAAAVGTLIHDYAESLILGTEPPIIEDPVTRQMAGQVEQFVMDFNPQYEATEMRVFNKTHLYAGTLDAIAKIKDFTCVLDYKTTTKLRTTRSLPPYSDTSLQLAAYRYAEFGEVEGQKVDIPEVDRAIVVALGPDWYKVVPMDTRPPVFEAFLSVAEVAKFQSELSKQVIGEALLP